MVGALLTGKYRRPAHRTGTIPRARLVDRLAAATAAPLTVLSAPAGFGKTTLLTEWLTAQASSGAAVAWLALEQGDNDASRFWTYVVAALQTCRPGVGDGALQALSAATPATDAALSALLNDLEATDGDTLLVLDDYHLIEAPDIHRGMVFLLDHLPPGLRVVIATRVDPPLPLAQLRARGLLTELRAADLRFTPAETQLYLNDTMHLDLGAADVATLDSRAEGWIAALQLAALSLQGRSDSSAFIAGFAGDDRYIVDYLVEEVLSRQTPEVRDFLLRTSILHRLSGPLCDAVTGTGGGRSRLALLERANLFLVALDDRREWFRFHQLFAEVLHAHLVEEHPELPAELHRRAAAWFDAHGDHSRAVAHALAGGDFGRAADLMELAMPLMRRERRQTELAYWIRTLPRDVLQVRPVLGVAFVGGLAQALDFSAAGELLDVVESLPRAADGSWPSPPPAPLIVVDELNYRSLPAHVQMYRAALALAGGDLAATIRHAEQALSVAPAGDALARAAAGALGGLASWSMGDLAAAFAAYTQSAAGLHGAGFLADVLGCTITLGDLQRTQGQLSAALGTYQQAIRTTTSPPGEPPLRGTADMHVGIAGVLAERNELDAAREHLELSRRLGEYNGLPQHPYRWRVTAARVAAAAGDLDRAVTLLEEADRVYVGDFAPNVQPVAAVLARLRIRRGELSAARDWARESRVDASDGPQYLREYEHLTLARLLIAQYRHDGDPGDRDRALALMDGLLAAAERGGRGASVIEVLILQAAVHGAGRPTTTALAALRRAVALAQPEGFVRLFADEGPPMAQLCAALRAEAATPPHLAAVIAAMTPQAATATRPGPLLDPLSDRELEVLRLLTGDLGGPDIARRLSVSLNTLRSHTKSIYTKLDASSRREAVARARELGILAGGPRRN